jgi:signal peptidase II
MGHSTAMSTTPDSVPAHDADPATTHPAPLTDPAVGPVRPGPVTPDAPADDGDLAPHTVPAGRRRRLLTVLATLTVGVLVVDQATKAWALSALQPGERTALVGDLLGLSLIRNPGAALSLATGMTWVLTVIAVVVVVVVVRASRRIGSRGWAVALGLLLGGAIGNLVDRFFREPGPARGHVVDFIAYGRLFIGNVADIAIVGAAAVIVVLAARGIGLDGSREADARRAAHHPPQGSQGTEGTEGTAQDDADDRALGTAPGARHDVAREADRG